MTAAKEEILQKIQEYLALPNANSVEIKTEIEALLPPAQVVNPIEAALANLNIAKPRIKIPKFEKGDNFARYCEKFREYVEVSKIKDPQLNVFFLQSVDDETYSTLKSVKLDTLDEKSEPDTFIPLFKKAIYGDIDIILKNKVLECKQKPDETISQYAYRLRETANIAYPDTDMAEENCLLAFLKGVKDTHLKRKINEATAITTFKEALKLANRLEEVDNLINQDTEITSILKETSFSFRPGRDEESKSPRPSSSREEDNNRHNNYRTKF